MAWGFIPIEGVAGLIRRFRAASRRCSGQIAEPEGGAAQVLEAATNGLGGSVGCSWPVEAGEHAGRVLLEGAAELDNLDRNTSADRLNDLHERCLLRGSVWIAVGGDGGLSDVPGCFDREISFLVEHRVVARTLVVSG